MLGLGGIVLIVWVAGDVIGEPMLETIAAKEGAVAAENALPLVTTSFRKDIDQLSCCAE